jgi:hypothetical protein
MQCEACGGKMNAAVAVCPHCGARRKNPPKVELDPAEIRALLVAEGVVAHDEEDREWLATLVLPHPSTQGAARVLELALTVVSSPFIAAGALTFALHRLRGKSKIKMRGELGPLVLMSIFGSLGMWSVLSLGGVAGAKIAEIVLGSIGALIVRAVVRSRSRRALAPAR